MSNCTWTEAGRGEGKPDSTPPSISTSTKSGLESLPSSHPRGTGCPHSAVRRMTPPECPRQRTGASSLRMHRPTHTHHAPARKYRCVLRLPAVVRLPLLHLRQLGQQENALALRLPDGLHDPGGARRLLELLAATTSTNTKRSRAQRIVFRDQAPYMSVCGEATSWDSGSKSARHPELYGHANKGAVPGAFRLTSTNSA